MAPPRVALPVHGKRRSPVGARLRSLIDTGGCLLVLFIAVGLGIFLLGLAGTVGPYRDSLRQNNDPRSFLGIMAFGTVFVLVALRMLQIVMAGGAHQRRRGSPGGPADRPWEWDHPWRPEGMAPDYGGTTGGMVLGRVAILALIGLFNFALAAPSWVAKAVILLFDAFGLLILYDSLQKLSQWLRFRRPVVAWRPFPSFLGGTLEATVRFPRRPRATGPARATLRCVRDERTARPSGGGRVGYELEPHALYAETREVPLPGEPGRPLDRLEVAFEVPDDLPGTDLVREEATYWQLLLQVPMAGPDFETVFLAPVYRRVRG